MDERPRWLRTLEAALLWLLGGAAACLVDVALARKVGWSPVLANPLRDPHPAGPLDLLGWTLAGACLPATLFAPPLAERLVPATVALLAPAAGLAAVVVRGPGCAFVAVHIAAIGMLVLPALERRRARAGWPVRWLVAALLMAWYAHRDPVMGIYGRNDEALRWIGAAACGATWASVLWRAGLRLTALVTVPFWAGAVWTFVANYVGASRFTGGLLTATWRCGGPRPVDLPLPPAWVPLRPSLDELVVLVGLLWLVERAARRLDGADEPAACASPDGSTQSGEGAAEWAKVASIAADASAPRRAAAPRASG